MAELKTEVERRRTFAIISHPDAGKTTLTEKLLLYGGAIHMAGAVKAKKSQKHTTSDWMEIEKQRGISISTTVLQFDYDGFCVNLLDTPGHKDFSEDTYRTLVAADAAVMLIDAAKGVEPQTIKLFDVCRMRGLPIFTFVNKMDRPCREPLDLIDELEKVLGIRSTPMTWPIGSGDRFKGVYSRERGEVLLYESDRANASGKIPSRKVEDLDDPYFKELLSDVDDGEAIHEQLKAEVELLEMAGDPFDRDRVLKGELTPIFFGSALNNFGVEAFLQRFLRIAPHPVPREAQEEVDPATDPRFSSFIFKIQANMDPSHRDRVAFMRVCSGHFERGMDVKHNRTAKNIKLSRPLNFFAQERVIVENAWPGDILGVVDTTGSLRIGDTLCSPKGFSKDFGYKGVPRFSPEQFASVLIKDPMKRKQLAKGLEQLSEEGVIQMFKHRKFGEQETVVGAVGILQFEVLKHRLQTEYKVEATIETLPYVHARWAVGKGFDPEFFERRGDSRCLDDRDGNPVVLFKSDWALRWAEENCKDMEFLHSSP